MGGPRSGVLELAVLGLLHDTPMHGYELRKRLNALLGAFRAFGYGSLYPCLKDLLAQGLIAEEQPGLAGKPLGGGRRSKIVYRLTAEGKERLQQLLAEPGPAAWEDDGFGVRFAFFGQTRADIRLRILEGRRTRLEEPGSVRPAGSGSPCRASNPAAPWSPGPPQCTGWIRGRRSGTRSSGRSRPAGSTPCSAPGRLRPRTAGPGRELCSA